MKYILLLLLLISCSLQNNEEIKIEEEVKNSNWTMMFYLGADNDLEYDLLRNIRDIKEAYQGGANVIIFIDRSPAYSINTTILGENFTGGRIYRIKRDKNIELLESTEIFYDNTTDKVKSNFNSADILILRRFIEYCKLNFPAKYYSLIIGSHGNGARGKKRGVVYDETNNDWIYTTEWTDFLSNEHRVDLLGLDACFMGNIEFLYQIRAGNGSFSAQYVVASPPTEWSYGWNYSGIFKRIFNNDSYIITEEINEVTKAKKIIYSSSSLTPKDLGKIIIEEQYDYTSIETDDQILALYDTAKIRDLKVNIDSLFVSLKDNYDDISEIRGLGEISQDDTLFYFDSSSIDEWIDYCYFDIYDICEKLTSSEKFSQEIKDKAQTVKNSILNVILYSFSGSHFKRFQNNITGLSFFFPDGNGLYHENIIWFYQTWYNSLEDEKTYGRLSFCKDNAISGNNIVENYFEVLNYWFDEKNSNGGYNGYIY